jgi:DNA repair protein RecO (recombination protein O)
MEITAQAIICSVRSHGETGAVVRALTADHGLLAGYVQGARGRHLRPVLIPGNVIKGEWRARTIGQLSGLKTDLKQSRAHLLGEPLAIAAIDWVCALTAATLPEAHPYPRLHSTLEAVLDAIGLAPAARQWAGAVAQYERLLLAELGYAEQLEKADGTVAIMAQNRERLVAHVLGEHRADVMAARERLVDRLKRAVA